MEKLKKFNHRLLAIIGSLVVLLLLGLTVAGIVALIHELTRTKYVQVDNAITIETPSEDSIKFRDQTITFLNPVLVDTANFNYLVPVSQIRLSTPEYYYEDDELLDSYSGSGYRRKKRFQSFKRNGNYNNFIIRNQKTGNEKILFDQKTFITSYQFFKIDSNVYLIFVAANYDSNKDRKLNASDLKSFFFYDMSKEKMNEIKFENMGFLNLFYTFDSNIINLEFGLDKNKNGTININEEPSFIKTFDYTTGQTIDLITEPTLKKVQGIID